MAPPKKPAEPAKPVELSEPDIDRCIQTYVADKTFSAAACVASVGGRVFHRAVYGQPVPPPPHKKTQFETLFDLASLTKPLATGLAALVLSSRGRLDLGASLTTTLPELKDKRFAPVTVDMLLDHTAGFPATRPYFEDLRARDKKAAPGVEKVTGTRKAMPLLRKMVAETRFDHDPGSKTVYSDIGFMVLGWIIENVVQQPLDQWLEREIYRPLGIDKELFFVRHDDPKRVKDLRLRSFAVTEQCPWREKLLLGEVHDPNAWAVGGVAGHAGLFGTIDAVWKLMHALWQSYQGDNRHFLGGAVRRFWTRSKRLKDTTRALAWDTPSVHGSMAGKRFSLNTVGHLGFTGCSIWLDLSSDVMGIVLANSAYPTPEGKQDAMAKFRPRLYELIAKAGESLPPEKAKPTGGYGPIGGYGGYGTSLPIGNPLRKPSA